MYKASVTTKRYDGQRNRVSVHLDESILDLFYSGGSHQTTYEFKSASGHLYHGIAYVHVYPNFDYVNFELRVDLAEAGWASPFLSWFAPDIACSGEMSDNIFRYLQSIAQAYGYQSEVYQAA